jgi:putative endonuclease
MQVFADNFYLKYLRIWLIYRILSVYMNPVKAFHYVYVLKSLENGNCYTGCTSGLRKRFSEHNEGKSEYTKTRGPYELIYYEASLNKNDAFARERYLKS